MNSAIWRAAGGRTQGGRRYQEDAFAIGAGMDAQSAGEMLVILADGMGGHAGGDRASALAIEQFRGAFAGQAGDIEGRLAQALAAANDAIGDEAMRDEALAGMGCTLLAAWLDKAKVSWVSVGDSPFWLFAGGRLTRLNDDHSMAPILAARVRRGEISEIAAARHPSRNALRSAVTGDEIHLVDLASIAAPDDPNAALIFASDGILTLDDAQIEACLRGLAGQTPENMAAALLEAVAAKAEPDQDNTTVVVAKRVAG